MLIIVALLFLHQDPFLNRPTVPSPEIESFMHRFFAEGQIGNPGIAGVSLHDLSSLAHLFPAFLADSQMQGKSFSFVLSPAVLDIVDPVKLLPPVAPERCENL